jgi:hypothetical protein
MANWSTNLRSGELRLVLVLGFILFVNSLALDLSDVVAVSGFLSQVDVSNILIVWIIDMLLIALSSGLQTLIVDRFDRLRLVKAMLLIFAGLYLGLRLMFALNIPGVLNYSLLFLLVEQQWVFFPLVFWVFANDIFDLSSAKRLFPIIASWGFAGQIAGLGIAAASPVLLARLNLSSTETLSLNVLLYLLAYAVLLWGLRGLKTRQTRRDQQSVRETLTEGWGFVREVPAFRYLMLATLALGIVLTVVDFQFLSVTDSFFKNSPAGSFQVFYGSYRLVLTLIAIFIQTAVTPYLTKRFNLKEIFLFFPFVMAVSSLLLWIPGLPAAAAARGLFRTLRGSIDEPVQKMFLALVPEERRGRVSMFMDSYLFAGGALLGCLLVGTVLVAGSVVNLAGYQSIYLAFALAASLFAIFAMFRVRGTYDKSMLNWRLKRRQRSASIMEKLDF